MLTIYTCKHEYLGSGVCPDCNKKSILENKPTFQEGQEVLVAFRDCEDKRKATVVASGEHFTCVEIPIGDSGLGTKEIVENERVFTLDYANIKQGDTVQASCGHIGKVIGFYQFYRTADSGIRVRTVNGFEFGCKREDFKVLKTIKIGEFDVPEPLREAPEKGTKVYIAYIYPYKEINWFLYTNGTLHEVYLQRGLLHLTAEAATLHAKALLTFTTMEHLR